MVTDFGQYHDDIYDLHEFMQGIADIRIKYLADRQLANDLETAINKIAISKGTLIEKAMSVKPKVGSVE